MNTVSRARLSLAASNLATSARHVARIHSTESRDTHSATALMCGKRAIIALRILGDLDLRNDDRAALAESLLDLAAELEVV